MKPKSKDALWVSRWKIIVFLSAVLVLVTLLGTVVYIIEDAEAGFTSIPMSIYWAIVTVTTVGYGDIAPQTVLGQMLASLMMILGYAIIAVPTGIVGAELARTDAVDTNTQASPRMRCRGARRRCRLLQTLRPQPTSNICPQRTTIAQLRWASPLRDLLLNGCIENLRASFNPLTTAVYFGPPNARSTAADT